MKVQFLSAILLVSSIAASSQAQSTPVGPNTIDTLAVLSFNDFHGAFPQDGANPGEERDVPAVYRQGRRDHIRAFPRTSIGQDQ